MHRGVNRKQNFWILEKTKENYSLFFPPARKIIIGFSFNDNFGRQQTQITEQRRPNQWFTQLLWKLKTIFPKAKLPEKRLQIFLAFFWEFEDSLPPLLRNGQILDQNRKWGKCVYFYSNWLSFLYNVTSGTWGREEKLKIYTINTVIFRDGS